MSKSNESPLVQQYRALKEKHQDTIILFQVGDFYETFGEDAVIASKVLGILLTSRPNNPPEYADMAGFPHHTLDAYLHKLIKAGHRVAVCDQLEGARQDGIMTRGVTQIVTPGVAMHEKLLDNNSNNFLAALHMDNENFGIAFLDISTGEFFIAEGEKDYIDRLLQTFKPAEVLIQRTIEKGFNDMFGKSFYTYTLESWIFEEAFATESLSKHFQVRSLKGFGIESMRFGIIASGAILHYLKETEHPNLQHITSVQRLIQNDYLWMDGFTVRNLELLASTGTDTGSSLLKILDNTVNPMGARLLKRWIMLPLCDMTKINDRLRLVEFFIEKPHLRQLLTQLVKQCGDLERLVSKISAKKITPKETLLLAKALQQIDQIKYNCESCSNEHLQQLAAALNSCQQLTEKIYNEITENPPTTSATTKTGVFKHGFNADLDELWNIANSSKQYMINIQQREIGRTGIASLKIGFNNVFGYYLEVSNAYKNRVPADWIRKQTLSNVERYITAELKEHEEKITSAEEKLTALEAALYEQLLMELQDHIPSIQLNGKIIAIIDCLMCFAENAIKYQYTKPLLHEGLELDYKGSRHPVIERKLPPDEMYITNDIRLDPADQQIIILTGPNMSGKSAILRQTALITLMAHIGSFVPADSAYVPLTDKIFTRVGASDNLSAGESTFMVEMNETASILNNISQRSLILLDEIGRGTSTYDGISIAWSIAEFLHAAPSTPKTLFATHYHELNELEEKLPRIKNFHVTIKEADNRIIFLRKLAAGGSTHSFGIHVARMAGMPNSLIERADELLQQMEQKHINPRHTTNGRIAPKPTLIGDICAMLD